MKHYSRFMSTVLTTITLMGSGNAFAEDEDLLRNLFQRLEVYLGIMQANEREHENLLRSVSPPDAAQSAKAGEQIEKLSDDAELREETLAAAAINWNMLQPTEEVNSTAVVSRHLSGYCSAEEAATIGLCQVGLTVEEGGAADLLADTLLASPTISHLNNAISFVYMLTNPSPIPLLESAFQSEDFSASVDIAPGTPMQTKLGSETKLKVRPLTSEGVRTLAARYKQMALLSTAQFALNNIAAERNAPATGGDSAFATLKLEAERRFKDPAWHEEINRLPDTALLREMATMQALQLALDFKRYEQEQTMITLLAAQVANGAQTVGTMEMAYQAQNK